MPVGRFLPVVVLGLTFLAFLPVLDAGFLAWDDKNNLLENPHYRGLGWTQVRWMFTSMLEGHYIPLTWMSFGLNYVLGGMNPWGYHLGNLLLHAANAGVFYFVARRLLAAAFGGGTAAGVLADEGRATPDVVLSVAAAFAALVFGVHPLRAESVAWVTERRDVLCGLFFLLAVLAYLRGVAGGGGIQRRWGALSLGAFLLALLSKAAAMPLPAALLLLDIYPLRRMGAVGWRPLLGEKVPYLALSAAAALLAVVAQSRAQTLTSYQQYGVGARVGMTAYNLMFYPWKLVWAADLSPLYELPPRVDPLAWRFLFPTLALVVVTAALVANRRRCPGALAAWMYSSLLVLPVAGAVAHTGLPLVADRYSYLSGLGFAVLAGGGLAWILRERGRFKASIVSAVVLVTLLVILGWAASARRQSKIWHDSETLWRQAHEVDPDCVVCSINLGAELAGSRSRDPERAREAEALFRHAIKLAPDRHLAYHGLGAALVDQGRYEEAEHAFRQYIARDPASAVGAADLGLLRLHQQRHGESIPFLRRALAMNRRFPGLGAELGTEANELVRGALARALRERAEELRHDGKRSEADDLLTEAAELEGKRPAAPQSGTGRAR